MSCRERLVLVVLLLACRRGGLHPPDCDAGDRDGAIAESANDLLPDAGFEAPDGAGDNVSDQLCVWRNRTPAVLGDDWPPHRYKASMAYHAGRGTVMVHGGGSLGATELLDDLWEWDGRIGAWREAASSGAWPPPGRYDAAMAHDAGRDSLVLFGGGTHNKGGSDNRLSDTWEWRDGVWTERTPASPAVSPANGTMAYDRARGRVILLANGVWEWNGDAGGWANLSTSDKPLRAPLAFDSSIGRVISYGPFEWLDPPQIGPGWAQVFRLWQWDPVAGAWSWQETPPPRPPARSNHFDGVPRRGWQAGGLRRPGRQLRAYECCGHPLEGTWLYSRSGAGSWVECTSAGDPWLDQASMVYDERRGVVVLFSGFQPSRRFPGSREVWELSVR